MLLMVKSIPGDALHSLTESGLMPFFYTLRKIIFRSDTDIWAVLIYRHFKEAKEYLTIYFPSVHICIPT